jgi:hypothetical protein
VTRQRGRLDPRTDRPFADRKELEINNKVETKVTSVAANKAAELKRINLIARVDRTELVKFFQNKSGFASLPGYANKEVKSREFRILNQPKGWVVPSACYGRKVEGGPTETMRESLRAWVNKHLKHLIPAGSEVAVCLEDWHDDGPRLVIYRKVMK